MRCGVRILKVVEKLTERWYYQNMPTTYRKNFLSDVIFRVDFPLILEISKETPDKFQSEIATEFPILEPVKQYGFQIETKEDSSTPTPLNITIWRFKNKTGDFFIELNGNSLVVNAKKYTDYTSFKERVSRILKVFYKIYPSTVVQRLGLRYINQIEILKEKDLFSWSNYINENLIKNIDFFEDKTKIKRMMQVMVVSVDEETRLNIRAGIFNSNYPENITNKEFILDYDCYTRTPTEQESILVKLDDYNKVLTEYFEKSITSNFRGILNS